MIQSTVMTPMPTPAHPPGVVLAPCRPCSVALRRPRRGGLPRPACAWLYAGILSLGLLCSAAANAESLFTGEAAFRSLTGDKRAFRVGDMLTVLVYENSSASANANTTTEKSGGLLFKWRATNRGENGNLQLGDTFGGKGQIQRSGKMLAQLSVTVREVDPVSGLLTVAGEQQLLVNDEKQEIKLVGKVRPIDIMDNNTVPSNRLADARISYIGDGVLSEKQHPGILTRLLSWLGIL